jgi:hypothetical protein
MVVCGVQGGLGDKDEDKGVVNWKLLPAGIGDHCLQALRAEWVGWAAPGFQGRSFSYSWSMSSGAASLTFDKTR